MTGLVPDLFLGAVTGNPSQPDGYAMLVAGLVAEGITNEQIKIMGREVPGKLLMG